jgi:hypothetical protein
MLRKMGRLLLPESLRRKLNATGDRLARKAHDARWTAMTATQRTSYIEKVLGLADSSWLFLVGMNTTGTKLLVELCNSHPELRCLPREGQLLTRELPNPLALGPSRLFTTHMDLFRWTEDSPGGNVERMIYDWSPYYPSRPGILVDKSVTHVLRSRWLQRHFRRASFVATVRDPYATCEGIRRRDNVPIELAAAHWALCNDILLEDLPHLERKLVMRYEDLCAAPGKELERVRGLLGLTRPFNEQVVQGEFRIENMNNDCAPIQNFNEASYSRLTLRDFETISRIAGPTMERLGYAIRKAA